MLVEAHTRMLAPLLAIDAGAPLDSKAQMRMLTMLVQRDLQRCEQERRGCGYSFTMRRYGRRCDQLDLDVSRSPSLVEYRIVPPSRDAPRFAHRYRITEHGRRHLADLRASARPMVDGHVLGRIKGLCADMPVGLLEEAYGRLGPAAGAAELDCMVREDLARATPPIRSAYKRLASSHATAAAAMMETAEMAMSESEGMPGGSIQRRVILCLSGEIARECGSLSRSMLARNDLVLSDCLADADDLVHNLATYCEKKGIMRDPMAVPFKEILSKDEVLFMCRAMENA